VSYGNNEPILKRREGFLPAIRSSDALVEKLSDKRTIRELFVAKFPDRKGYLPTLKTSIPENVINHRWEDIASLGLALKYLEGILLAKQYNLAKQEELNREELMTIFENDLCVGAVRILKKNGFDGAKPFCYSPDVPKGQPYVVKSKKNHWLLADIKDSNKIAPPAALKALNVLKKNGFEPFDLRLGYEIYYKKESKKIARDILRQKAKEFFSTLAIIPEAILSVFEYSIVGPCPALLASFGPKGFYVELMRWD
jgi:hypothetical protein